LAEIDLPEYMHGGVKGRSPVTNARLHVGKAAVLNFDIEQFFPSVKPRDVYKMFYKHLRFPADVAHWLTKLVTFKGQLPQGAPTSTVVANLVIVPLAERLNKLAIKHECDYGQFVDDGALSGPAYIEHLRPLINKIIRQEGLRASPKPHKRVTMYRHQEQIVTGVRVNKRIDAPTEKMAEIKRQLDEFCSLISSRRRIPEKSIASLKGKIQYVKSLNKEKGARLERKFRKVLKTAS
jgi:RNA-directed DNA polymerase